MDKASSGRQVHGRSAVARGGARAASWGVLLLACLCGPLAAQEAAPGEWPMYRRDNQNAGFGPLRISGDKPQVAWRTWIGYYEGLVEASFGQGDKRCALGPQESGEEWLAQNSVRFGLGRSEDVCGDGNALPVRWGAVRGTAIGGLTGEGQPLGRGELAENFRTKVAKILPDVKGLQLVEFEDGQKLKNTSAYGFKPDARGFLWSFENGVKRLVWKTEIEHQCESPLVMLADMEGKGQLDVVVVTWYRAMVFDGRTGVKKTECKWDAGRNYGYAEVTDLTGEGFPSVVVLGDFMIQMSVLANDGSGLHLGWVKLIDYTLLQKKVVLHTGTSPVASLDGGKRKSLVVSLYNAKDDERWHAMIYDAPTGQELADLPDWHVDGIEDLGGDGASELLLSETQHLAQAVDGRLAIGRFRGGKLTLEELPEKGHWLTAPRPFFPLNKSSVAAPRDNRMVMAVPCGNRNRAAICVHGSTGRAVQTVAAYTLDAGGKPERRWSCVFPAGLTVNGKAFGSAQGEQGESILMSVTTQLPQGGDVAAEGCAVRAVSWAKQAASNPPVPIVARLAAGGPPVIVVETSPGVIEALTAPAMPKAAPAPQPTSQGDPAGPGAVRLWASPGRSVAFGWPETLGVVAADLFGDGQKEVLVSTCDARGAPALVALGADGKEKYRHVFQRFNGSQTAWNVGGMLYWTVGHFLDPKQNSVLVTLRRSVMHTEETCLLDVRHNKEVWWQNEIGKRGCGGGLMAAFDLRGTGRDDVIGTYPDITFALAGDTGKVLRWSQYENSDLGGWSAYEHPIVWKLSGAGPTLFQAGGPFAAYQIARRSMDGKLIWHTPYELGTPVLPGLGDVDGDGHDELGAVCPTQPGGKTWQFVCFDAAAGKRKWQMDLGEGRLTDVVACESKASKAEFIFGLGSKLMAVVGQGPDKGEVLWEIKLHNYLGHPILADLYGDGRCELLVTSADGYLYCIDGL